MTLLSQLAPDSRGHFSRWVGVRWDQKREMSRTSRRLELSTRNNITCRYDDTRSVVHTTCLLSSADRGYTALTNYGYTSTEALWTSYLLPRREFTLYICNMLSLLLIVDVDVFLSHGHIQYWRINSRRRDLCRMYDIYYILVNQLNIDMKYDVHDTESQSSLTLSALSRLWTVYSRR